MLLKFLIKIFSSQKGAMDKVIVTLLFIVIGVAALVGMYDWAGGKKTDLLNKANTEYSNAIK